MGCHSIHVIPSVNLKPILTSEKRNTTSPVSSHAVFIRKSLEWIQAYLTHHHMRPRQGTKEKKAVVPKIDRVIGTQGAHTLTVGLALSTGCWG